MPEYYLNLTVSNEYISGFTFNQQNPKIDIFMFDEIIITLRELEIIYFSETKIKKIEIPDDAKLLIRTDKIYSSDVKIISIFNNIEEIFESIYSKNEDEFYEYFRNKEKNVKRALQFRLNPQKHLLKICNVCGMAVKHYKKYINFAHYPDALKLAVLNNSYIFKYIDIELQTEELVKILLSNNPYCFNHVRDDLKTEEICDMAVKINQWNYNFIPHIFKYKYDDDLYIDSTKTILELSNLSIG